MKVKYGSILHTIFQLQISQELLCAAASAQSFMMTTGQVFRVVWYIFRRDTLARCHWRTVVTVFLTRNGHVANLPEKDSNHLHSCTYFEQFIFHSHVHTCILDLRFSACFRCQIFDEYLWPSGAGNVLMTCCDRL
jgi:hypothetical protein